MSEPRAGGTIVLLNGASSSGNISLARALQEAAERP
jgi:chloramphenicol 3-O-phosphotransferase